MSSSSIVVSGLSAGYRIPNGGLTSSLLGSRFRSVVALKNINFELSSGDRLGIIGQNGSGKSTLLKVLAGELPPRKGRLEIVGERLVLLNRKAGLIGKASLEENAYLKAYSLGISGNAANDFVEVGLRQSGLEDRRYDPLNSLSNGMSGRFNLALNSQIIRPVVIIDEWIGALDNNQSESQGMLGRLKNESEILVLASHDEKLIRRLCNKVIVLNGGEVEYFGSNLEYGFERCSGKTIFAVDKEPAKSREQVSNHLIHIPNLGRAGVPELRDAVNHVQDTNDHLVFYSLSKRLSGIPAGEKSLIIYRQPLTRFVSAFLARQCQLNVEKIRQNASLEERQTFERYQDLNHLLEDLSSNSSSRSFAACRAMQTIRLARQNLNWYMRGVDLESNEIFRNWQFINYDDTSRLQGFLTNVLDSAPVLNLKVEKIELESVLTKRSLQNLQVWFKDDIDLADRLDRIAGSQA